MGQFTCPIRRIHLLYIPSRWNVHSYVTQGGDRIGDRRYCSSKKPNIAQSFTSTYTAADGKVFSFATVVMNSLHKGESPVASWSHACSLIGHKFPTLSVAFVSKPTKSAVTAIEEIAAHLSSGKTKALTSSVQSSESRREDPNWKGTTFMAPLIGCVAEPWNSGTFGTSGKSNMDSGKVRSNSQYGDNQGYSCSSGSSYLGSCLTGGKLNINSLGEESNEDNGNKETTSIGICDNENHISHQHAFSMDFKEGWKEICGSIGAMGLFARTNMLKEFRGQKKKVRPWQQWMVDQIGDSDSQNREMVNLFGEQTEIKNNVKLGDKENGIVGKLADALSSEKIRRIEVGKSVVSPPPPPPPPNKEAVKDDEEEYMLVLCVSHMPGAKVISFYSSTTGLPYLSNMKEAVTINNPHMLLLGAPGFPFNEFIQRLSAVFPGGSRAGAFLKPLFNNMENKGMQEIGESKPIFYGTTKRISGVVGLAISSDGKDNEVPVNAISEFLRMSFGMVQLNGYMFFDNTISNCLFLPKNAMKQHQQKTLPVDPGSFIRRLNSYLLRNSKQPKQAAGKTMAPETFSKNFLQVSKRKGPPTLGDPYQLCSINGGINNTETMNVLPLAFDAVLFPGWSMPFHIYEPRYRYMVKQCIEHALPFGLSTWWYPDPIDSNEIVGTVATLEVYFFERDCRSYIVAHGAQRFRLLDQRIDVQPGSFGLNIGKVQFFDDNECETAAERHEILELAKHVVQCCKQLIPEANSVPGLVQSISDPTVASFAVGHILPVPNQVKRRWLSMVDTKFRLMEQLTFLDS